MFKRIKKSINKFLDELAKENQKTFGNGKIDCCNLNRTKNEAKRK